MPLPAQPRKSVEQVKIQLRPGITSLPRLIPILFFMAYLLGSVLVFAFGPMDVPLVEPTVLYSYLFFGQLVILIGYLVGLRTPPKGYNGCISIKWLLFLSIICHLCLAIPTISFRLDMLDMDPLEALMSPGASYHVNLKMEAELESNLGLSLPRIILSPLMALLYPLGIIYWGTMSSQWRALWVAAIGGNLFPNFLIGTNKMVVEFALQVPWLLGVYEYHRYRSLSRTSSFNRQAFTRYVRLASTSICIVLGALAYQGYTTYSRAEDYGYSYAPETVGWSVTYCGIQIPTYLEYSIYSTIAYWTGGYAGLDGCLQLPFEWCYGMGHSTFLMRRISPLFFREDEIWNNTYLARLEGSTGYSATGLWHTIYPWLASDLSFFGAVLFMGVMSFCFAQAWSDTLRGENPFAMVLVSMFLIMFCYIPANNVLFIHVESMFAFCSTFALWRMTRSS